MKKFPVAVASSSVELPFSHVLIGLYRMRAGSDCSIDLSNKTLFNLIFRLTHVFAQGAEEAVSNVLVSDCPDATVRERMHPYQARLPVGERAIQPSNCKQSTISRPEVEDLFQ